MRWLLLILVTSLLQLTQGVTVELRHTHGVFYPDVKQQAILQLKITGEPGEKITKLEFSDGKTTQTSDIQMAYLSTSGGWNGYTLNTNKLAQEKGKAKPDKKGKFSFNVDIEIGSEPVYYWLSYNLGRKAKRGSLIDALCTRVTLADGSTVKPKLKRAAALKERVAGRIYPFPYRVVPYYRPRWVKGWGNAKEAVHLTPEHFNLFTDLVHFAYTVSAEGDVQYQWAGEGADPQVVSDEALAEIKRLHNEAKAKSLLLAGFAHMDEPMTQAVANPETRRKLARNMATWAIERGYNGIDIDWEYPDTHDQWVNFGLFIADLREELAGSAFSISIAASVTYKVPIYDVTDQLDFLMTMSYDDLADQHSSMGRFQGDAHKCLNDFHMPRQRVVIGLPFYSNQKGTLSTQYGYSQIISWYPRIKPTENEFQSKNQDGSPGPMHSFNGPQLIAEKCRWMKQEKFGGVMIWAYDTDVKLNHRASLAKAMYKVVRQPKAKK
ncbi:MAG: glycoside hydrolase family 18 protein [Akkermansia sp.]|nr:glycoside hydrolase family 18 protein [Akkermansia sp.]